MRALVLWLGGSAAGLTCAIGGAALALTLAPEPDSTIVVEGATACVEAIAAAQDAFDFDETANRARASAIAVTADILPAGQEGRGADLHQAIEDSAAHKEDEADELVKRDAARADFDAASAKCAPERDR